MADSKITGLNENTAPATTDVAAIIDDPGGTPAIEKITLANLLKVIDGLTELAESPAASDTMLVLDGGTPKKVQHSYVGSGGNTLSSIWVAC